MSSVLNIHSFTCENAAKESRHQKDYKDYKHPHPSNPHLELVRVVGGVPPGRQVHQLVFVQVVLVGEAAVALVAGEGLDVQALVHLVKGQGLYIITNYFFSTPPSDCFCVFPSVFACYMSQYFKPESSV